MPTFERFASLAHEHLLYIRCRVTPEFAGKVEFRAGLNGNMHNDGLVHFQWQGQGKKDDVVYYTNLLRKIKDAFVKEYTTASGRLVSSTQTAYVLTLNFDMLPENLRAQAAERLAQNVKDYGNHLTTGFLGTPYLCHVLSRYRCGPY